MSRTPARLGAPILLALLVACSQTAPERTLIPRLTAEDTDPALGYERPPALRARDLFPAGLVSGPRHRVRDEVATDGFFRLYTIESDFGTYEAAGDLELRLIVQEIRALSVLDALGQVDAYADAADRAARVPWIGRWRLVDAPVDTIEGVPPDAWSEVLRIAAMDPDHRTPDESTFRRGVIRFEVEKRRLARRLAVNPYSLNRRLQRELNRAAWTLSAGGFPADEVPSLVDSSAAPLAEEVLPADRVARLFANDSPEDLRRHNRIELAVMGLSPDEIEAFLDHRAYSPRRRTGLVESLVALEGVRDRGAYVRVSMLARSPHDALFRMMTSFILRFHHLRVSPIERLLVLANGRTPAAYTSEQKLIVAAHVDYLVWSRPVEGFVRALTEASLPDVPVTSREVWLSGEASPRARQEIEARGVRVVERVFETMVPRLAGESGGADPGAERGPEEGARR